MFEFKREYKNHVIEIVVDNIRTHTMKLYSLIDFGKNIGIRCPVEKIEYVDENDVSKVSDCCFKQGLNKDKPIDLIEIYNELDMQLPTTAKLEQILEVLSKH